MPGDSTQPSARRHHAGLRRHARWAERQAVPDPRLARNEALVQVEAFSINRGELGLFARCSEGGVDFWIADLDIAIAKSAELAGIVVSGPIDAPPFRLGRDRGPAGRGADSEPADGRHVGVPFRCGHPSYR